MRSSCSARLRTRIGFVSSKTSKNNFSRRDGNVCSSKDLTLSAKRRCLIILDRANTATIASAPSNCTLTSLYGSGGPRTISVYGSVYVIVLFAFSRSARSQRRSEGPRSKLPSSRLCSVFALYPEGQIKAVWRLRRLRSTTMPAQPFEMFPKRFIPDPLLGGSENELLNSLAVLPTRLDTSRSQSWFFSGLHESVLPVEEVVNWRICTGVLEI